MKNKPDHYVLCILLLFLTQSLCAQNCESITDSDGNVYKTIKVGNQCWMAENMRSKADRDGKKIPGGKKSNDAEPYRYYPDNSKSNVEQFGYLYNVEAAQKVCPNGWHLPNNAEWNYLKENLRQGFAFYSSPAGKFSDEHREFNVVSYYWSSDAHSCWYKDGAVYSELWRRDNAAGSDGYSVRCIQDGVGIVNTISVREVTGNSVKIDGEVLSDGNATVTSRGVCWNQTGNPDVSDSKATAGEGIGRFVSTISSLTPGTQYYVRTYVTNVHGTAYGEQKNFTTLDYPKVKTGDVSDITTTSAVVNASVVSDGGAAITERGVCWSKSQNPTTKNDHYANGTVEKDISVHITNLEHGTTYYVRAYATNSVGTSYGKEMTFKTLVPFVCGKSTVKDHEGNEYNTVQIGAQCWTKENMRCKTSPSTGKNILEYPADSYSFTGKKAYYVNGNANNTAQYGLLYNWCAAVDTFNVQYGETSTDTTYDNAPSVTFSGNRRGICPTGWHVPGDDEWDELEKYVSSQSAYRCDGEEYYIAKALASKEGWEYYDDDCTVGNNSSANNATGFSAVPAGVYYDSYDWFGFGADFWSATQLDSNYAYNRGLSYGGANVGSDDGTNVHCGYSVRCLRD